MDTLIFVGVIVLFSILEAVARRNKEQKGGGEGEAEHPPAQRPPSPRTSREGEGRAAPSSEGLIPADVWEEIQNLARGGGAAPPAPSRKSEPGPEPGARPVPAPHPEPAPAPVPGRSRSPRSREPRPLPGRVERTAPAVEVPEARELDRVLHEEHPVHLTHARYGTPVAGRLTAFGGGEVRRGGRVGGSVPGLLKGGQARLREAVVLHEVLGPPVSLRDDGMGGGEA